MSDIVAHFCDEQGDWVGEPLMLLSVFFLHTIYEFKYSK